jgi:hypothetical protein
MSVMVSGYRCYICGVQPQLVDVTQLGDPEPRYMPGAWPPGDHTHSHALAMPTPYELSADGDSALAAIVESWQL